MGGGSPIPPGTQLGWAWAGAASLHLGPRAGWGSCDRSGSLSPNTCPPHSSPKSRKDLLKAVHSVLRDKHRRQLLKAESLPSSQQYVPFGGRRLCALKGARPAMSRAGTVGAPPARAPPPPCHRAAEAAAVLVGDT